MLGDTDGKKCNNNDFKKWHEKSVKKLKKNE